jgi:phosphoglycolate phosphatase-like HAD superfamily hydrolase
MTLADLVGRARCLLIDFDGPICAVFAGHPATTVAQELHAIIRERLGGVLPSIAALSSGPLHILGQVDALGDEELTRAVADACRDAETAAVATARPTPGAEDLLRAAHHAGRRVAIVSNNASQAVETYLRDHDLAPYIDGVAARFDGMLPRLLKPHPFLIERGLTTVHARPADVVFIGDSVSDVEAGQAAATPTIGYANKPGKRQRLTAAGADVVIDTMHPLVQALQRVAAGPSTTCPRFPSYRRLSWRTSASAGLRSQTPGHSMLRPNSRHSAINTESPQPPCCPPDTGTSSPSIPRAARSCSAAAPIPTEPTRPPSP